MQAEQNNLNNVTRLPQSIKPYKVKNLLLANAADWFIEEETLKLAKSSLPDLIDFYKSEGVEDPKELSLKLIIEEPVKDVYNVPLFSDVFCKLMMDEIENMQKYFLFSPNPDEDQLRQIPEIVLNEITPDLHNSLMNVIFSVVNPIFLTLWNRHVTGGGIQIANYNLKDKKQGAWHHDASADISMVVPLNTGDYVGGGTEFLNRGVVKPLPKGNALIFPSYTHLHRGLPVQSGNRYLLVFWLTSEREI